MANVLFKRGNTATINGTAISDGQLLYNTTTGQQYIDSGSTRKEVGKPVDTTLSTTSTNAIANNALTNSIINTTAEVSAITADNIPCGTKPVKELITNLNNINVKMCFDLLGSINGSTQTLTSLDLNKYEEIKLVAMHTNSDIQGEITIPLELFKTTTSSYKLKTTTTDGTPCSSYYINDSSVYVAATPGYTCNIYGIKVSIQN